MAVKFFSITKTLPDVASVAFRQPMAETHCRLIHGHDLSVTFEVAARTLDARNWVIDYGAFKFIKKWIEDNFDHKYIVPVYDPYARNLAALEDLGIVEVTVVPQFSVERLAQMIGDRFIEYINDPDGRSDEHIAHMKNVRLWRVTVFEGQKNASTAHYDISDIFKEV